MRSPTKIVSLYFNLSRKESNGFFVLCLLIPVFIFLPLVVRTLFSKNVLTTRDQLLLDSLTTFLDNTSTKSGVFFEKSASKKITFHGVSFDPNTATEEEMNRAGMPSFISKRIIKFRSKGGIFKTKEDVKKIYGLTESTYKQLYPYIQLSQKQDNRISSITPRRSEEKKQKELFDLNKADSLCLIALKGIGPSFASRILKYRKKLGGFISMDQLKEVYGLDSIASQEILVYGSISSDFIPEKINLNSNDENALYAHPYIGKKFAKIILAYRNQHGNFPVVEQLKNIKSISEQNYGRMYPYLKAE